MDEDPAEIEARLSALEILIAFQFASQHMQTADPAGAIKRLQSLLMEGFETGEKARADAIESALKRLVQRIVDLQAELPKRLVD